VLFEGDGEPIIRSSEQTATKQQRHKTNQHLACSALNNNNYGNITYVQGMSKMHNCLSVHFSVQCPSSLSQKFTTPGGYGDGVVIFWL